MLLAGKASSATQPSASIQVLETLTGKSVLHLEGHERSVQNVAFAPNGAKLCVLRNAQLADLCFA